ncbi:MAG: formyltransferase family protein [Candidatus Falkowbacteria bacterium]
MSKKKILIFASGDKTGGGSGFQEMVEQSRTSPAILDADIVGVVSNHANGGVRKKAMDLAIAFEYCPGPFTAETYRNLVAKFSADYVMCSGWLKLVVGLNPSKTINIHPGPLPEFGGPGLYGHHVHEAVIKAFKERLIFQSCVSIHFVNDEYDRGPGIVKIPVLIRPDDTPETLAARVNKIEHGWQSYILNEIIHERIRLQDGTVYFKSEGLHKMSFR